MNTRRHFIALLGGAAVGATSGARGQQSAMPTVGWLSMRSENDSGFAVRAVRRGLNEAGYIDGSNVAIEFHWLDNNYEQLPSAIRELVERRVSVIVVIGSNVSALAAKSATDTIPIVFANGGDPIRDGLVLRINQPGGNVTGVTFLTVALGAKRLELLRALVPNATAVAMLVNPRRLDAESQVREAQAAARVIGVQLQVFNVRSEGEMEAAFAKMIERKMTALLVGTDPFFTGQRHRLSALAARHHLPAIYSLREYAEAGGLMSYGASLTDAFHQVGVYAGRILKGEKAGDLPVVQPTRFELVINLKAAKTLGLEIPPTLLARADEVIE